MDENVEPDSAGDVDWSTFRRDLVCPIPFGQGQGAGALDTQSAHLRIPVNDIQVHQ